MNLQFQYKNLIFLLAAIPFFILLFLLLLNWKKRVRKRMGEKTLIKKLTSDFSPSKFALRFALLSLGFGFGVIAVMNPRKPGVADNVVRKGIDVVVALDVSNSMLATDLAPTRLERARQFIVRLMKEMPEDRIGLVLFAGRAYLQMPLTSDHGSAQLYVSAASPTAIPQQGTVIGEALNMGVKAFNPKERRYKSIVLISDGEDHDYEAIKIAGELKDQGVMINSVGVGSPEGSFIPDPVTGQNKVDASGVTVISKLNEESLKQIADETNGIYVRLQETDEAVDQVKKHLSQIESKAYGDVSLMNYKTFFMWFAAAMFLLLVLEQFISEIKKKKA